MVILGIGIDQGTREKSINPKANRHLEEGTFPLEEDMMTEITEFEQILIQNEVIVFRPQNIKEKPQVFTRDIGFVIGNIFFVSKMSQQRDQEEIKGVQYLLDLIEKENIVEIANIPENVSVEGGDIMLFGDKVFVGKSNRTNDEAFLFLKNNFEKRLKKEFIQVKVNANESAEENVLHLDCAFQPIGKNSAIIYEDGIINLDDFKTHLIGVNLISVSKKQAYRMFPNIFSISPTLIVIEKRFFELKHKLLNLNRKGLEDIKILEVNYSETSKMSGLLRCSTLPLLRKSFPKS
jgi:N-dimethylarginine dimethylaminohydrolase